MADPTILNPFPAAIAAIVTTPTRRQAARSALDALVGPQPDGAAGTTVRRRGDLTLVATGPDQWLALATGSDDGPALERRLAEAVGAAAFVREAGDARAGWRLSGPAVRDLLATMTAIDLHPRAFPPDAAAVTDVAGINVLLLPDGDGILVIGPASAAVDLRQRLITAGAVPRD